VSQHGEIERATKWTSQGALIKEKYEPYPITERLLKRLEWLYQKTGKLWSVEELEKANIDRSLDARHRIAIAVAQLEAEGAQISKAAVARKAGASRNTVTKHSDLLAKCSSVYNGGSGGLLTPGVLLASPGGFSGENGFERSAPAAKESKTDEPVFVWGLTEIKTCPSGSESVVSRPVSSELSGLGPKNVSEPKQIAAFAARESTGSLVLGFGTGRVVLFIGRAVSQNGARGSRAPPKWS
jgi:hypothetical protein